MSMILQSFCDLLAISLALFNWCLLLYILLGVLVAFGVVKNQAFWVVKLGSFLSRLIDPVLSPFRKRIPRLGGFDLSILALFITIAIARSILSAIADHL